MTLSPRQDISDDAQDALYNEALGLVQDASVLFFENVALSARIRSEFFAAQPPLDVLEFALTLELFNKMWLIGLFEDLAGSLVRGQHVAANAEGDRSAASAPPVTPADRAPSAVLARLGIPSPEIADSIPYTVDGTTLERLLFDTARGSFGSVDAVRQTVAVMTSRQEQLVRLIAAVRSARARDENASSSDAREDKLAAPEPEEGGQVDEVETAYSVWGETPPDRVATVTDLRDGMLWRLAGAPRDEALERLPALVGAMADMIIGSHPAPPAQRARG